MRANDKLEYPIFLGQLHIELPRAEILPPA